MQISVLIVEDDITFSLMLKTWLGKKGFQVETAASVADAKINNTTGAFLTNVCLPPTNPLKSSWMTGWSWFDFAS